MLYMYFMCHYVSRFACVYCPTVTHVHDVSFVLPVCSCTMLMFSQCTACVVLSRFSVFKLYMYANIQPVYIVENIYLLLSVSCSLYAYVQPMYVFTTCFCLFCQCTASCTCMLMSSHCTQLYMLTSSLCTLYNIVVVNC